MKVCLFFNVAVSDNVRVVLKLFRFADTTCIEHQFISHTTLWEFDFMTSLMLLVVANYLLTFLKKDVFTFCIKNSCL